jgi:tetratricopeptide (TPR) repeat protein
VDAIEVLYPDRLTEQVERLAGHAFRGEVWEKAVGYLRQAGLRAMARAANRDAAAHFEQALEALRHLPEHRETTELAIDLRFDIRTALVPLAEWDRMQDHLRTAESLASALGDQRRLGRVSIYMVIQAVLTQEYGEAVRFGRQALAIGEALGDLSIEAPANAYLGVACQARGDHLAALDHLQRNVNLIPEDLRCERFGQATSMASFSRSILSLSLSELGRFDEAIARAEEAAGIAEDMGQHRYSLSFAWHALGWAHASRGDLARGLMVLGRCVDLCRTSEFHVLMPAAGSSLSFVLAQGGRATEAVALTEEIAGGLVSRRFHAEQSLVFVGAALLLADRSDAAAVRAHDALETSRFHGARASQAHALHLLGELAMHRDSQLEAAEQHYREALNLATELEMRPLEAHCHLGLAKLSRHAGDRSKAGEHLARAVAMYRAMDMISWSDKAEAALGPLHRS